MKKFKDTLGDVFKGIALTGVIVLIPATIANFTSKKPDEGFMCLAMLGGCLFSYWLISTLSKIMISLKEISDNSSAIRSLYESKMNESTAISPISEPVSTENKE